MRVYVQFIFEMYQTRNKNKFYARNTKDEKRDKKKTNCKRKPIRQVNWRKFVDLFVFWGPRERERERDRKRWLICSSFKFVHVLLCGEREMQMCKCKSNTTAEKDYKMYIICS